MTHHLGNVAARVTPFLALVGLVVFLAGPFRTGWNEPTTDFPNYYTAAVLVRQGRPLRNYYDWTWFQRQMDYAGIKWQLGAYTPQTPLTMLPMVAFSGEPPQVAKRVWLAINLILLAGTVTLLARVARIRWDRIALLMFCGFGSLASNFVLGQYYVFLLFLLTLTLWCEDRKHPMASGVLSGMTFVLKLYTGPLLLYFAAKKKWSGIFGMAAGSLAMVLLAVVLFGWSDVLHYATNVLPRTLEGGSIDPYNPGNPTLATLLRRSFIREPQLNPHPLLDAPCVFFFLLCAVQLGLPTITALGIGAAGSPDAGRDFAWFVTALMLLSTSVGAYSFILLSLPVTLILKDGLLWERAVAVGCYVVLNAYIQPRWWFPKVCLLVVLFIVAGRKRLLCIPRRWALAGSAAIAAVSVGSTVVHMSGYNAEPGRRYTQLPVKPGMFLASYPVISKFGLFFQCMGTDRYGLCWSHDDRLDTLSFDGQALQPAGTRGEDSVWFELVANRRSRIIRFDPSTMKWLESPRPPPAVDRAVSPDSRWVARTLGTIGSREIWVENAATGQREKLAGGACDNAYPAWELDSSAIIFASDCGRAYGLPALYRATVRRQ